jgi:hypothetical protein
MYSYVYIIFPLFPLLEKVEQNYKSTFRKSGAKLFQFKNLSKQFKN